MDLKEELRVTDAWTLKGELTLSCNCEVFCPCVLSLGQSAPTEGYCLTWAAFASTKAISATPISSGVKFGFMAEIPGQARPRQLDRGAVRRRQGFGAGVKALTWIMTGRAGGSTGSAENPGRQFSRRRGRCRSSTRRKGETRIIKIEKIIDGAITPVRGKDKGNVVIRNSEYWISPDIMVSRADKSRFRLFGRNWNFEGRSAEICKLDWGNQKGGDAFRFAPETLEHDPCALGLCRPCPHRLRRGAGAAGAARRHARRLAADVPLARGGARGRRRSTGRWRARSM